MVTFKPKKYNWKIFELKHWPIQKIVDKYKCHKTAIYYALRKLNIRRDKYIFSECHKKKIKQNHISVSGKLNPNYKDGNTTISHYCIDCKKEVCYNSVRCYSCHNRYKSKKLHKDSSFLSRSLMGFFRRSKCTGKSKIFHEILNYFYPNKFKYVGDGTLVIDRYTPDFYDGDKSLIEFFGEYWHKNPRGIKTDRRKLKMYKKLGYRCLVIWEKELENFMKLKSKLNKFVEM